ncbi:asparagine synthase-related protein [Puniceicoccaceae bacterium K14]|nr:asparagine synthase-related protein [Puniceicoccaceae bacterium K14]
MSIQYGVYRTQLHEKTIEERDFLADSFEEWKCDYVGKANMESVAFGCRVLRIYPESKDEQQPLKCKEHPILLTADCRLDNREELAHALGVTATDLLKTPDSSLILEAYLRWGRDCFQRLDGDFAIAIWDQHSRQLLLARDVTGVRPLAYATWDGGAAFSSSIPELYHLPSVPEALDDLKIAAIFGKHSTGRERTPFKSIKWVHPGAVITICDSNISKEIFATIKPMTLSPEERRNPAPRLGELLKESVRKRIRGQGDLVCELSGGFDSGSITALVAKLLEKSSRNVSAISWTPDYDTVPPLKGPDERNEIQWIEQHYSIHCSYVSPCLNKNASNTLFESSFRQNAASAIGNARTVLSGSGGDECASFYLRGFHPHALLADGIGPAIHRLLADFQEMPFGYQAPLRLIRGIKGMLKARIRNQQFKSDKSSIINSQLKDKWRQALAQAHGDGIMRDILPSGAHDCMTRAFARGHLEQRAATESLDAAHIGVSMAYPMQDAQLLSFMISLPSHYFNYSSRRRQLFRRALDSLTIKLAPNTRKQEEALATRSQKRQSPSYSKPAQDEMKSLQSRFFKSTPNLMRHQIDHLYGIIEHSVKKN